MTLFSGVMIETRSVPIFVLVVLALVGPHKQVRRSKLTIGLAISRPGKRNDVKGVDEGLRA